jgi:hypothetical protein
MNPLTLKDIANLRELERKATPGSEELNQFPIQTTKADWKWKAENFVRWIESGVILKTHDERVEFLSGEYQQIYSQGVIASNSRPESAIEEAARKVAEVRAKLHRLCEAVEPQSSLSPSIRKAG